MELGAAARGPWRTDAAHGGAPAALLTRAIEAHGAKMGMRLAAFHSVFLGPVMLGEIKLSTEVLKPGRRLMVVGAQISAGGRTLIEARGVLLRVGEVELPNLPAEHTQSMPPLESARPASGGRWGSGDGLAFQRTSNTIRLVNGGPEENGRDGAAWFRLDSPLVPGERPSPVQRAVAAADFGNGLAHPISFTEFVFVNCDLNVWLLREPVGEWIGVSAVTEVSTNGSGVTRSGLYDSNGRFGTAGQSLYVDPT
ncbi:MAG: thioesterase family protein [Solirubrobacterales bacterium]